MLITVIITSAVSNHYLTKYVTRFEKTWFFMHNYRYLIIAFFSILGIISQEGKQMHVCNSPFHFLLKYALECITIPNECKYVCKCLTILRNEPQQKQPGQFLAPIPA